MTYTARLKHAYLFRALWRWLAKDSRHVKFNIVGRFQVRDICLARAKLFPGPRSIHIRQYVNTSRIHLWPYAYSHEPPPRDPCLPSPCLPHMSPIAPKPLNKQGRPIVNQAQQYDYPKANKPSSSAGLCYKSALIASKRGKQGERQISRRRRSVIRGRERQGNEWA